MWYKIKISRHDKIKDKIITEYYLTEDTNFAYAGIKVIKLLGNKIDVEDVQMLKDYKPSINEYKEGNKVYIIKVAEDQKQDDGTIKTLKYPMPCFANNDTELYKIVKNFLTQGLYNMRLTTISETKWTYIK